MAHWIHYKYNRKKGRYERRKLSRWNHFFVVLRHLLSGTIIGALLFYAFISWFGSPYKWRVEQEHELLKREYKMLNARLDEALGVLEDIGRRDDNMYRVVLQGDPIGEVARMQMVRNMQRYDSLRSLSDADLVVSVAQKMDLVERQLHRQSQSFDELLEICRTQEDRLKHVPAIQPVSDKNLKRVASGYGWRIDPVYHIRRMHQGMDFAAEIGTDVFATGDGVVVQAGYNRGYGLCVTIDHGYGYETLYAHLSKKLVNKRQRIKRGEKIGEVGSTGKSTGPHLHYEVHYRGKVQNPANYYFLDLTPEQYEELIEKSETEGQVMD
ncbi:MAG: M23 family metallopeptidase [Bacteroidales bacterium]|nr:M23 family metallopeptidase [Bacteroidales bacterium]